MKTLPIIYENEEIYIIHKPPGLATQGGKGIIHSIDTLMAKQIGQKIHLVHRLDKDTEGLLIIAKNTKAAHTWATLIASKEIKKEYYALCFGNFSKEKGQISQPILQNGVEKTALTHYSVETSRSFSHEDSENTISYTVNLVRLQIETGRMHQIRKHLAQNGTPIIGDDKYGDFKANKILKKHKKIKSLQLAAIQLTIPHHYLNAASGSEQSIFSIPLPHHMNAIKNS